MTSSLTCANCGSTGTTPIIVKFGELIGRCRNCGLIYADPRIPAEAILARYSAQYFWNEYLPANSAKGGVFDLNYFDRRYAAMLKLIETSVGAPGKMLEVGTGAGFFLKAAQRAGWQVQGIEISDEAIAFARNRLGLEVAQLPAEQLGSLADSFDVVVMFEVIEHLFEPRLVLEAVQHLLRPGGALVISTPNFDALSRFALGNSWAVLSPGEHLYYFTHKTLAALLVGCGFTSIQFHDNYAGWGLYETMNPRYTHAPDSLRTRLYSSFVASIGGFMYRRVLAAGRGDTLLCTAHNKNM